MRISNTLTLTQGDKIEAHKNASADDAIVLTMLGPNMENTVLLMTAAQALETATRLLWAIMPENCGGGGKRAEAPKLKESDVCEGCMYFDDKWNLCDKGALRKIDLVNGTCPERQGDQEVQL